MQDEPMQVDEEEAVPMEDVEPEPLEQPQIDQTIISK